MSSLPPVTPSVGTVHVASLFLGTLSTLTAAAQLLDLERFVPEPAQVELRQLLAYADVCQRMLTYADVCWRMPEPAQVELRELLAYADEC